ncbi:C4-dicarboxylate ABC transporter [Caldinitratiruptor microaerophilus]|uniref:C4-dicarboxylate ABC transporter n=2 Tax=Caldinitratiruptor microaerophilus TaxID=671077 RepID=A0AA35CLX4_9FIRM|nr:C4-dicarboxylate ABC transporter [Caldinitratiruptor microaerophilus]
MVKLDRESGYRRLTGKWAVAIAFLGVALGLFHLYTAATLPLPAQMQRATQLAIALGMIFLLYPARRGDIKGRVPWYDVLLAILGLAAGFYPVVFYEDLVARAGLVTTLDLTVAAVGTLLVLEATRRVAGWPMVLVALGFLAYALWGNLLPGLFRHRGYSLARLLEHTYLGLEGIFGIPLGVSATVIFVYLLFAQFLEKTGIRQFFVDIAMALTGQSPGGPAKVAVVSSALEGTISGSSIANTAGSGSFTIPMMKRLGYRPEFAAAVEASASTGGQLMPPIMGAAAFVMVEFLNIPYIEIAKAAAIPALLYFTGVFLMVHLEALRSGLTGLPRDQLPRLKDVVLKQGYLVIPLVVIFWLMDAGFSPARAAVYGMALAWVFGLLRPATRMGIRAILRTLEEAARSALGVIAACATAGIIVGVVTLTGIGLKLSNNLLDLAGQNLWVALFFTMIASLVLGMGLPTTATYIVLATMAAPALEKLGVAPIAAHLFVFYFGIVADITPPVALASYAGAAIAGANPMKTGVESVKLALGAFLVPYIFAVSPSLVLVGATPLKILLILLTATTGMAALGAAVTGHLSTSLRALERLALAVGGILLVDPGLMTDLAGAAVVVGVFAVQFLRARRQPRPA